MCLLSTATLMMSVSCGLLVIENTPAPTSLEQTVMSATFQSKISDPGPMSAITYSETDEARTPYTNTHRETTTSKFINIQENISADDRSSDAEGDVNERLNTTETPGSGADRDITGNGIKPARTQYNGYLRQTDYDYYMLITDAIRVSLNIVATPVLVLTVVSFSRDKKTSLSCKFVMSLNAFEFVTSVFNLVLSIMKYTVGPTHKCFVVWVLASNYCIVCCRRTVYGLNLLLSGQKLFAVVRPIKSHYSRDNKVGLVFLAGFPVFVFVYHIYLALMFKLKETVPLVFVQAHTEIYTNNKEMFNNLGHYSKVMFSYAPLVITLGINFALLGFLKQHSEKVKNIRATTLASGRSRKDRQMTLMIVVSTLAYTVLSLPANVNQMLSSLVPAYSMNGQERYLFSLVKNVANSVDILGSLSNFIAYMSLSSGFRHHVMETLLLFRRIG